MSIRKDKLMAHITIIDPQTGEQSRHPVPDGGAVHFDCHHGLVKMGEVPSLGGLVIVRIHAATDHKLRRHFMVKAGERSLL